MSRRRLLALFGLAVLLGLAVAIWRASRAPVFVPPTFGDALVRALAGDSAGDEFGHSLAACGDLDGDGVPDFVVDAPNADVGADDAGFARVYSGASGEVLHTLTGDGAGWYHGHSVACLGDVDGDEVDDVVVGLIGDGFVGGPGGGARVFSGRTGARLFDVSGELESDHFGSRVAAAGDVNADGTPDFIVGAPGLYTGNIVGYARVHSGKDGARLHRLQGRAQMGDRFGYVVAGVGDVDRDGHADVAVGALRDDDAGEHSGALYIFSGASGAQLLRVAGERAGDELGHDLALVGDLNGDGHRDLLVGAFARERPSFARVLALPSGDTLWQVDSEVRGDAFGHTVANAGDVTGDGVDDWAVGVPDAEVQGADRAGRLVLYSGADGARLTAFDGVRSDGHLGYAVRALGDLDGDGRGEVLVGSTVFDAPGAAWVLSPCRGADAAGAPRCQ